MNRLYDENRNLSQIIESDKFLRNISFGDDTVEINYKYHASSFLLYHDDIFIYNATWNEIFAIIDSSLNSGSDFSTMQRLFEDHIHENSPENYLFVKEKYNNDVRENWPVQITEKSFNAIIVQFQAMDLIDTFIVSGNEYSPLFN